MWNIPSMWDRNRAPAGFDRTHNLQIYGVYSLPFAKNSGGFAGALARNWQLNGIFSAMSGTPFSVGSAATSLNAPGNSQTANQVLPEVRILGGVGRGTPYFDTTAFAPVTAVQFGNTGRNIMRGRGIVNLDASIFRDFPLTERWKLQFRAEAFNVSNTPAFNNPAATVTSAGFGEITGAQTTERQLRFALKLFF
jgi:hypothetical protein